MPISRFVRLALAVIVSAVPCANAADGQNVHRCIGEHGEISFSGAPCAIANALEPSRTSPGSRVLAADGAIAAPTCPVSADALRDVIAQAFARRDANTIAGVMRWDGVSGATARERMSELAELTGHPLLGIDIDGRNGESAAGEVQPAQAALLTVRIGSIEGAGTREFRLTPAEGCYWLDW